MLTSLANVMPGVAGRMTTVGRVIILIQVLVAPCHIFGSGTCQCSY